MAPALSRHWSAGIKPATFSAWRGTLPRYSTTAVCSPGI